mmetsp:Transcript_48739/g.155812  ORF Transcript_48739/g.155812 Transcript_48739/m.155812 type:complete len:207 (+) Transcript_48739:2366-2986(+)
MLLDEARGTGDCPDGFDCGLLGALDDCDLVLRDFQAGGPLPDHRQRHTGVPHCRCRGRGQWPAEGSWDSERRHAWRSAEGAKTKTKTTAAGPGMAWLGHGATSTATECRRAELAHAQLRAVQASAAQHRASERGGRWPVAAKSRTAQRASVEGAAATQRATALRPEAQSSRTCAWQAWHAGDVACRPQIRQLRRPQELRQFQGALE